MSCDTANKLFAANSAVIMAICDTAIIPSHNAADIFAGGVVRRHSAAVRTVYHGTEIISDNAANVIAVPTGITDNAFVLAI